MLRACRIICDATAGLEFLHSEEDIKTTLQIDYHPRPQIAHGNICPHNIFLKASGEACIGNLDVCVVSRCRFDYPVSYLGTQGMLGVYVVQVMLNRLMTMINFVSP